MADRPAVGLLGRMLREEWRLHATLFGDRFAAFPLAVAGLSAAGFRLLGLTGAAESVVVAGMHGLIAFFGLQVGTIGLVGRDALRDVVGDVTLLVFSARTLPVSWGRLLGVFLVKDLLYYSALFVAPVGVGYGAVALWTGGPLAGVALLWLTVTGAFALGVGTSLTLAGLGTRSRPLLLAAVATAAGTIVVTGVDPVALTPYAVYSDPSLATAAIGFGPAVALVLLGPALFRPAETSGTRTSPDRYGRLRDALRDESGVATRSLLEVARSSGSVWKVLFSMGVLFVVTALLVREVGRATALDPSPGIAFGTLLGLGAFTTYSWVTMYDDAAEYLRYPIGLDRVFAGKAVAYLALSLPAGGVYLLAALYWVPLREVAVGAVIFPLVAVYVFGVTAYFTGLSPNELLFDTPLFVGFGAVLGIVSLPLIVAALVHPAAPTAATAVAVGVSVVAGAVGALLTRLAGPRWHDRARRRQSRGGTKRQ